MVIRVKKASLWHKQSRKATDSLLGFKQEKRNKKSNNPKQKDPASLKLVILLAFVLTVAVFPNWQQQNF